MKTLATIIVLFAAFTISLNAQWVHSSSGLPNGFGFYEQVNTIAKGGNTLYVSQNQRIFKSTDNAGTWIEITGMFPPNSRYISLAGNNSRMFVALDTLNGNVRNGRLFYSEDGGATWIETGIIASSNTFGNIEVKENTIYAHGGQTYSYRSDDNGNTWNSITVPERGSEMAITENDDVYLASDFHVYRSTDKGATWIELSGIGSLPTLYADGNTIYGGTRSSLVKSTDNGQTWESIIGSLSPSLKKTILYVRGNNLMVSVGESSVTEGVFKSTDGGTTWEPFNDGYPNTPYTAAIIEHEDYLYSGGGMKGLGNNAGVYKRPVSQLVTDVEQLSALPESFILNQNYPNPFNPVTKISFTIPEAGNVVLKVYNTLGEEAAVLLNNFLSAGSYAVDFNAASLPSGTYIYKLISGSSSMVKKMSLLK